MFNYDGYLNKDYPSFVWLLLQIVFLSLVTSALSLIFPDSIPLILGLSTFIILCIEIWLGLGGKRWMLCWCLMVASFIVIAIVIAYPTYIANAFIVLAFVAGTIIGFDAIYYKRRVAGTVHFVLAIVTAIVAWQLSSYIQIIIPAYFSLYALARLIDYIEIKLILSKREPK